MWSDLNEMKNSVSEFLSLWDTRPFRPNPQGMELNHSWATWYLLRTLEPDFVVESGVWRGHSTWLIERTLPNAEIFSFDVDLSRRIYLSERACYNEMDLVQYDWSTIPKTNCVVFLDDHQDALQRMKDLHWLGFSRIIFEDNYQLGLGDFYDLNALKAGLGWPVTQGSLPIRRLIRYQVGKAVRGLGWMRTSSSAMVSPGSADWQNAKPRIRTLLQMPAVQLEAGTRAELRGQVLELHPDAKLGACEDLRYNSITLVELH